MIDPLRTDRSPSPGDVPERDRDARIEELLLLGLDHYFAGQYELAVSVWSRVLFLDRNHARARAYIERARSAIAEGLREGEELLHGGVAAFDRGDANAARRLLTSAVERGVPTEEAFALLDRLDRLEAVRKGDGAKDQGDPRSSFPPDAPLEDRPAQASRLAWIGTGVFAGLALALIGAWLWTGPGSVAPSRSVATPTPPGPASQEPLPISTSAEAALTRAERLWKAGRLHDALDLLGSVRHGDPLRPRADVVRAAIQRQLLDTSRAARQPGAAAAEAVPRR